MGYLAETESQRLLAFYKETGDIHARDQLVVNYTPLVRSICRRFRNSREPQEDLLQIGMIGFLNAIAKFDADRGNSLPSLAIPEILGAILNYLRDHGSLIKAPRDIRRKKLMVDKVSESLASSIGHWPTVAELVSACDLSEAEVLEAAVFGRICDPRSLDQPLNSHEADGGITLLECVGSEDAEYDLSLDRLTLAKALETLPARERTILTLRFHKELSQRQIAERIKISQMHVSRLERGALQKLRAVFERSGGALAGPPRVASSSELSAA